MVVFVHLTEKFSFPKQAINTVIVGTFPGQLWDGRTVKCPQSFHFIFQLQDVFINGDLDEIATTSI